MDYRLKIVIGGLELMETADVINNPTDGISYIAPSIARVILQDNASSGTMQIGATPSDLLTFTINDPNRQNYDGEKVVFWIAPPDDDTANMTEMSAIEDGVGMGLSDEGTDEYETTDEYDDADASGDDPTAEDIADVEEQTEALIESRYATFEGEDVTLADEDTDEAEEEEWRRIGTYYVYSQTNADTGDAVVLKCYDSMQKLNGSFVPSSATATIQNHFDDLRSQALQNCGITIDPFEYSSQLNRTVKWPAPCSYREALGWFAGLIGAFATCGDDGSIGFSMYSFSDGMYLDSTLNFINVDASGEMELDGIRCNIGTIRPQYIEAGFEADLTFDNPLMTTDALEDILEEYKGIRFSGGRLNMEWDDSIQAGSFIRIMTPEEYANYVGLNNSLEEDGLTAEEISELKENINGLGRVFLVSSQLVDFTGNASTTIASNCESVTQASNTMTAPTDAKFRKVTAELVETQLLVAQKASIADLEAATARIGDIEADTAKIHDLTAEELSATVGYIGDLTTGNVSASDIVADHGTVGSLNVNYAHLSNGVIDNATIGHADVNGLSVNYASVGSLNAATSRIDTIEANEAVIHDTLDATNAHVEYLESDWISTDRLVLTGNNKNNYPPVEITEAEFNANKAAYYTKSGDTYTQCTSSSVYDSDTQYYVKQTVISIIEAINTANNTDPQIVVSNDKLIAASMDVAELSAITANMGTLNAGKIQKGNNFINLDTSPASMEFKDASIWDSATQGIKWDGTDLKIKGNVNITSGNVYTKIESDGIKSALESDIADAQNTANIATGAVFGGYEIETIGDKADEVNVDEGTFISMFTVGEQVIEDNYEFTYNGSAWTYGGTAVNLNDYGITFVNSGYSPTFGDAFTVSISWDEGLNSRVGGYMQENDDAVDAIRGEVADAQIDISNAQTILNSYLGENGYIQIVGDSSDPALVIGRSVSGSDMQMHLTSSELGFYQDGQRVAYINGSKLHISNSEIIESQQVGNFVWFNRGGRLTLKYVGQGD